MLGRTSSSKQTHHEASEVVMVEAAPIGVGATAWVFLEERDDGLAQRHERVAVGLRLRRASRGASKGLDASAQPAEHRVGLAAPSTREFDGLGRRRGHHSARGKLDRQQMNGGDNGGFDRGG